ncbi:Purine catabolism regulatory protein [compost metagenome]
MHVSFYVPETTTPRDPSTSGVLGVTVASVLVLDPLREAEILAGAPGMTRPVRGILSLDLREVAPYARAGELVISSRVDWTAETLKALIRSEAAGLLILTDAASGALNGSGGFSKDLVAMADTAQFPILRAPLPKAPGELLQSLQQLASSEGAASAGLVLSHQLTQIALDGAGLEEIVKVLASRLDGPVLVEDRQFNLMVASNPQSFQSETYELVVGSNGTPMAILKVLEDDGTLRALRNDKSPVILPAGEGHAEVRHIFPVVVGGEICGFLSHVETGRPLGSEGSSILLHATHAVAIELLKQKGIAENEQKMRRDFFRDLLFSNGNISPETLHRRATYLGYQLSSSYWVLVVEYDVVPNEELLPDEVKRLASTLNSLLSFRQALVITQTQGATILYPVKEGQPTLEKVQHLAETIRQKVSGTTEGWTVSIGVGMLYPDLLSIPRAYREAQHAVKIGRALGGTHSITSFSELGIYRMLLQFAESRNPNEFFCEALERLLEYDQQADKELVKTLRAFLECNGNLTETSDRLFIHRNTLKYRLERIRDITQIDLDDSENRLMLHLGLKMNQIVATLK